MRFLRLRLAFCCVVLLVLNVTPAVSRALGQPPAPAAPSGLAFTQIKMTGDEFLLLQNDSGTRLTADQLSSYWLYDFNNVSPLSGGVSGSQQQLPAVTLDAGQSLLLSSTTRPTCGAAVAGKLNVSLTDGSGFLQLVRLSQDQSGGVQQTGGDVVSWSSGAGGQIPNVPAGSKDPQAVWYRYQTSGGYGWQPADIDANDTCQMNVTTAPQTVQPVVGLLAQPTTQPPATIVSIAADPSGSAAASLPAGDLGLVAPQITELLPNPDGTGTDATDEFIELYNSNAATFDLSGFVLQTGSTTKHSYTFPAGTKLPPRSFHAFYAADTGLSLSNTSGAADLLDPLGNVIGQTDLYGTAKDGLAWALAKGTWYWTSQPTPGIANVIKQPASTSKSSSKSKKTTAGSTAKASGSGGTGSASGAGASTNDALQVTPIHPWTLAVVAVLAVAYGVYEYRLDLANRFYRLRKHYAARRADRQTA